MKELSSMELRQLQYVLQIAADKNFSRAAEKLHIAQPSLSQQLSKLEKEIGVLLFRRSTNSVELTHAGAVFVERAQMILDMSNQLIKEMDDISQMRKGKLTVGSLPITGAHVLPLVLPAFKEQYPDIEIVLVEDTTSKLESLTASGQTDISLLSLPIADQNLDYEPLIEEEICLAVPPNHPLAEKHALMNGGSLPAINLAELSSESFIVLKRGQGFRQIAFDLCEQAGFVPHVVFESTNIETVQSLVAAGMGLAFVPHMVTRSKWSELVPVYFSLKSRPTRTLVIAYRKDRYVTKAAEAFIETMKQVMRG
jgi:LysR family transcriptional regulator, hydrogen peroxide-inducible genes activator